MEKTVAQCLRHNDKMERIEKDFEALQKDHKVLQETLARVKETLAKFMVYASIGGFIFAAIGGAVIKFMMDKILVK